MTAGTIALPAPNAVPDASLVVDGDPAPHPPHRQLNEAGELVENVDAVELHPFAVVVREQLRAILDSPTFGLTELGQMARFIEPAQRAMQALSHLPTADLLRTSSGIYSGGLGSVVEGNVYLPGTENYGAKMVREVIDAAKSPKSSQTAMVRAIIDARDAGMNEIADALEADLRGRLGIAKTDEAAATDAANQEVTP